MTSLHESCMGLDIFAAIHAHVQWKQRLQNYIQGESQERLDPAEVGSDCKCALGQWIYSGATERFSEHPTFHSLQEIHADFHKHAAEIVSAVHNGKNEHALHLLHRGHYPKVSNRIKTILAEMSLSSDFK